MSFVVSLSLKYTIRAHNLMYECLLLEEISLVPGNIYDICTDPPRLTMVVCPDKPIVC